MVRRVAAGLSSARREISPDSEIGDLPRPDLQHQPRRLIGEFLRAEKAGQRGSARSERNGNSAIRVDRRDMGWAIAQPSSARKRVERVDDDIEDVAKLLHISP